MFINECIHVTSTYLIINWIYAKFLVLWRLIQMWLICLLKACNCRMSNLWSHSPDAGITNLRMLFRFFHLRNGNRANFKRFLLRLVPNYNKNKYSKIRKSHLAKRRIFQGVENEIPAFAWNYPLKVINQLFGGWHGISEMALDLRVLVLYIVSLHWIGIFFKSQENVLMQ